MNLVDQREPTSITKALGWEVRLLASGDFSLHDGLVGIERKTVSDLLSRMNPRATTTNPKPRSLADQLQDLRAQYQHCILLIEGWMSVTYDGYLKTSALVSQRTYSGVMDYLLSIQYAGVKVIWTPNETQTVRQLLALVNYYMKPVHSVAEYLAPPRGVSTLVNMLAVIPGIGYTRATTLAEHYPSMEKLLAITEKELLLCSGIGPKLARTIWESIR